MSWFEMKILYTGGQILYKWGLYAKDGFYRIETEGKP